MRLDRFALTFPPQTHFIQGVIIILLLSLLLSLSLSLLLLFVNNETIPPVKQDECFTYLGRHFDYKMTNNQHKDDLLSDTKNIMKKIDDLPLHPKNKILIYQRYMFLT